MGCGMGIIKYMLFIFNFIFVLCGLAILVIGVVIQITSKNYSKDMDEVVKSIRVPAITLIVIGCIIFVIAFMGCCGAIRESHCMVVTFACLLLVILIIQVAIAIFVFVAAKNTGELNIKDEYRKNIFNRYNKNKENTDIVDAIQETLECCGVEGPYDFSQDPVNSLIPGSCCGKKESSCSILDSYKKGCGVAIEDFFKSSLTAVGGVAMGIAAAELIGIIFALCLANSIRNAERRGYSV